MYWSHLFQLLRRHKSVATLASSLGIVLVILASFQHTLIKTSAYLVTLMGCFLVSEFVYHAGKLQFSNWKIKSPRQEFNVAIFCELAGVLLLVIVFMLIDRNSLPKAWGMVLMTLRFLFVFPVVVLVYLLAIKRYTLGEIGFSFKHGFVALPLIILIGTVSFFGFPEGVQWEHSIIQNGYWSILTLGFLTAAIPEEILRNFFQSRLSKVLNSNGLAWVLASLIWALSHIPFFGSENGDYAAATLSAIGIMPIGLLWGYLNQRYRSIIPSIIIHGTNLWGLHNIL